MKRNESETARWVADSAGIAALSSPIAAATAMLSLATDGIRWRPKSGPSSAEPKMRGRQ